ncbi:MAG: GNAT family N-acetyltransferase [Actinobacteria bacterium]|nr:GNAT family N-acetyltransferase [Actinomycetota bacterium]
MESARPAHHADLAAVAELATAAGAELCGQRGGLVYLAREGRRLPLVESLAAAIDDPDQHVAVGTVDDVIVGYGVVRLEHMHTREVLAVIDDIYVDPMARGIGVGESIMDDLVAFAVGNGAIGIDATVLPGMRDSKNFFETFGLVARAIVVHRGLPSRSREDGSS